MDDDDGQAAYHADQLIRRRDEEEALRHLIHGVGTERDIEVLADGLGLDINELRRT